MHQIIRAQEQRQNIGHVGRQALGHAVTVLAGRAWCAAVRGGGAGADADRQAHREVRGSARPSPAEAALHRRGRTFRQGDEKSGPVR
jgi:hypothetical protein